MNSASSDFFIRKLQFITQAALRRDPGRFTLTDDGQGTWEYSLHHIPSDETLLPISKTDDAHASVSGEGNLDSDCLDECKGIPDSDYVTKCIVAIAINENGGPPVQYKVFPVAQLRHDDHSAGFVVVKDIEHDTYMVVQSPLLTDDELDEVDDDDDSVAHRRTKPDLLIHNLQ